jgi:hypothetical protein
MTVALKLTSTNRLVLFGEVKRPLHTTEVWNHHNKFTAKSGGKEGIDIIRYGSIENRGLKLNI